MCRLAVFCVCFLVSVWLEKGCNIYVHLLVKESDHTEVTLCGWQHVRIQFLSPPCCFCFLFFFPTTHTDLYTFTASVKSSSEDKTWSDFLCTHTHFQGVWLWRCRQKTRTDICWFALLCVCVWERERNMAHSLLYILNEVCGVYYNCFRTCSMVSYKHV